MTSRLPLVIHSNFPRTVKTTRRRKVDGNECRCVRVSMCVRAQVRMRVPVCVSRRACLHAQGGVSVNLKNGMELSIKPVSKNPYLKSCA